MRHLVGEATPELELLREGAALCGSSVSRKYAWFESFSAGLFVTVRTRGPAGRVAPEGMFCVARRLLSAVPAGADDRLCPAAGGVVGAGDPVSVPP
jgi:hypothetical protein